jgi:hypothetical protein
MTDTLLQNVFAEDAVVSYHQQREWTATDATTNHSTAINNVRLAQVAAEARESFLELVR